MEKRVVNPKVRAAIRTTIIALVVVLVASVTISAIIGVWKLSAG